MSEQPKEYIMLQDEMKAIYNFIYGPDIIPGVTRNWLPAEDAMQAILTRGSRPHLAPAFKRCCDSCINVPCKVLNRVPCLAQEKQENVCEENGCTDIENCDEICQHSRIFSPLQMQEAKTEAARQACEDVLKEFMDFYEERKKMNPITNRMCIDLLLYKIESLQGERE